MKLFIKIIFIYLFVFLTPSFSCSLDKLNLNNNFNDLKINNIFTSHFKKETKNNNNIFNKYILPIEEICINQYGGFLLEVYSKNDKIFRIVFINSTINKKVLLELAKNNYSLNFQFETKIEQNTNHNSQIKKDNRYYYYNYFAQDPTNNRGFLEIFEIVNPQLAQEIRTIDEMKEEIK